VVLSDGNRTVALAAIDGIGIYREDVEAVRRELGWQGGRSFLFLSATHDHAAPDLLGLWGPLPATSGIDERYRRRVRKAAATLVKGLSSHLEEVQLSVARSETDPRGLCRDTRDPAVIDPELLALQARSKNRTVATVVRWSCHAEVLGENNFSVSADYPGALCSKIEKESGGACLFFAGDVGGLLTPERSPSEPPFDEVQRIGEAVAARALGALGRGEKVPPGDVLFNSEIVRVPIENSRYLLFLPALAAGHRILDSEGRPLSRSGIWALSLRQLILFPLPERLRPWVESEVSLVRIGPVAILGVPGELFPELAIGGYGGEYAFGRPLVGPSNPNPPKLAEAPKGPYLREKMRSRFGLIVGLANDELGYIVPDYDFQAAPTRSMLPKPKGTHYEETNSIGRRATGIILGAAESLLSARERAR